MLSTFTTMELKQTRRHLTQAAWLAAMDGNSEVEHTLSKLIDAIDAEKARRECVTKDAH